MKSCAWASVTAGFAAVAPSFFLPSFHPIVCWHLFFLWFHVCASHVLLYLSPPPPSGWCQCCCQAGVESSQSCGSLLWSSGVMLGSFMLIRWALPNVGHAPPYTHTVSLSPSLSHTHARASWYLGRRHKGVLACTSACLTSPHALTQGGVVHRAVATLSAVWQQLVQLFLTGWAVYLTPGSSSEPIVSPSMWTTVWTKSNSGKKILHSLNSCWTHSVSARKPPELCTKTTFLYVSVLSTLNFSSDVYIRADAGNISTLHNLILTDPWH